jgi:aspartate dehydrogenase
MRSLKRKKILVGILGCGAIGSRMALAIKDELKDYAVVAGVFDIQTDRAEKLAKKFSHATIIKHSIEELVKSCDLMVEAVNAKDTQKLIRRALTAKKDVLVMSVGKLLDAQDIFKIASKNRCRLLVPSGAVAGLDAIKAASQRNISKITLTTRKPTFGFSQNDYITRKKINLSKITSETVLFDGDVKHAVEHFPQNINVAAAIALASLAEDKLRIRIITSPEYKLNSHEIEVVGDFGRLLTRTENEVCPDNPKTSYLAVLSAIQTLRQYFQEVKIGT